MLIAILMVKGMCVILNPDAEGAVKIQHTHEFWEIKGDDTCCGDLVLVNREQSKQWEDNRFFHRVKVAGEVVSEHAMADSVQEVV